ncbi:hypothetical protein [Haliscomenobacter sp.]|uniref:hypothetical protein n=1 Tax=Haliscomenobacter sp. TaxID=2717303 RepID=UPI003364EC5B
MIVDQLFTPKPLQEGGPYDLPGIDYPRSGDTPPKRRSAPSDYPYSKEQDDDYFREIFRKKREAAKKAAQDKEQGVAEGSEQNLYLNYMSDKHLEEGLTDFISKKFGKNNQIDPAQSASQTDAQTAPPAKTGGAQRQAYAGTNPATGKPWTVDELQARMNPGTSTAPAPTPTDTAKPAAGTFPGEDPKGPGYAGRREVARRQAARDADAAKKPAAPNFAQQGGGYKSVNYAPNIKTGINLPKPTAPAGTKVTAGGPTADEKAKLDQRIAQALKQPVTEMLQMVETKEDVQRIKQFVDDTFVRYGAVNESAFAVRNQILEHVTQTGAQRRREYSQRVAH